MSESSHVQRWMPVLILVAALAALFHRLALGEVIFWGTPLLQFYPWRAMAFNLLRAGHLPLWNPLAGNGVPLLANYQTAVFYPPNWLYLIIPTEYALGIVGVLHLVWAGLGMMAYLRRLGVDRLGQGVAALSFALSGYLVARFGFLSITSAVAWLPWLLWAVDGVVEQRDRPAPSPSSSFWRPVRAFVLLAGVVAMQLLAGHAQTTFYSLAMAGAYALIRSVLVFSTLPGRAWRAIHALTLALGGVALGIALAAVQLVPTFELMQISQRSAGLDSQSALSYSFWPWHFLTLALPNFFGSPSSGDYWGYGAYWEDAVYVGLLTLVLAGRALGVWWRGRRQGTLTLAQRSVPFWVISLLPVTVLALGWNTPIFPWLFDHVPTFDLFNGPARWMILAVFALSVLGGIGAHDWQTNPCQLVWARLAVVAGVGLGLSAFGAYVVLRDAVKLSMIDALGRLGMMATGIGMLVLLLDRAGRDARRLACWQALALIFLATDLVSAHWGLNPTVPAAYYHQRAVLADRVPAGTRILWLPQDEYQAKFGLLLSFTDFRPSDRADWDTLRGSLLPNLGMLDGVPAASNFDPLEIGHHAGLLAEIESLPRQVALERIAQMNVGLLLSAQTYGDLEVVEHIGPITAYRVPDPWPRAALADCAPQGEGVVCTRIAEGTAAIRTETPTRVAVVASADAAVWLVLIDTHYPGWQAVVDGAPTAIERANGAFRAVPLTAGDHEVVFTYRPVSLQLGAAISGVASGGWATLVVLSTYDRKRHRREPQQATVAQQPELSEVRSVDQHRDR